MDLTTVMRKMHFQYNDTYVAYRDYSVYEYDKNTFDRKYIIK